MMTSSRAFFSALALVLLLAAPASATVTVIVGQLVVGLEPEQGWTLSSARFKGQLLIAPHGTNGTAIYVAGRGWGGGRHGDFLLEEASIVVDHEGQSLPPDGGFILAERSVRIETVRYLAGAARVESVMTIESRSITEHIDLQGVDAKESISTAYVHLGTRSNDLVELQVFDEAGRLIRSTRTEQDDGSYEPLGWDASVIEQRDPTTGRVVRTEWSRAGWVTIWDRQSDNKVYFQAKDLQGPATGAWSSSRTLRFR